MAATDQTEDDSHFRSKKFVALMVVNALIFVLGALVLAVADKVTPGVMALEGFLVMSAVGMTTYYVNGQGGADEFVALAKIAAEAGVSLSHKGLNLGSSASDDNKPPAA